ncbi:hypothetical protein KFK09_011027 [Dendrobium nobile]|uniref:Protein MIZU-KUSSEI 1 n=1 Tax=Dendrobium nobile TaxID=94219 RepID=A0A8T3BEU1_DENNO|nr:hypothetical protein KFK09_011027 [Dendrobium nobile]
MSSSTEVGPIVRFPSSSSSSDGSPLQLRRRTSLSSPPLPTLCLMSSGSSFLRSFFPSLRAAYSWLRFPNLPLTTTPRNSSPSRRLTITFFGHRKGRINFAVQENPRSHPLLLLELATPTSHLVKEMASGMVRILLESEQGKLKRTLWEEPVWSMFCNGQRCGYAVARECTAADLKLLSAVSAVSVGAGVMHVAAVALPSTEDVKEPAATSTEGASLSRSGSKVGGVGDGEIMYMRARFERVVGSKDSEALYMMNPDTSGKGDQGTGSAGKNSSNGAPELSIFLLRV